MSYTHLPHSLCAAEACKGFCFFCSPSNLISSPSSAQLSVAMSQEMGLLAILLEIEREVMWSRGTGVGG